MVRILVCMVFLCQVSLVCNAAEKEKSESAKTGSEKNSSCVDTRVALIQCDKGKALSHTGCSGESYMKICLDCWDIRVIICLPEAPATLVPECGKPYQGTCIEETIDEPKKKLSAPIKSSVNSM
jgi:hypothetical protein